MGRLLSGGGPVPTGLTLNSALRKSRGMKTYISPNKFEALMLPDRRSRAKNTSSLKEARNK